MNEPTADEIMKMFAVDIAVLRRGRRKPSEKPPVGKKKAKASKKPVKLTAEQLARKREHTRQWRMAHREQVLEYNRRTTRPESMSKHPPADTSLRIVRHSTISAVRNRRPTNATTTCFIQRRENGSVRLFETLIQYRLQGWVQPVY
jgi:hypothetical protein